MADFFNFELEDLSEAFHGVGQPYNSSGRGDRIEIGYQDDLSPRGRKRSETIEKSFEKTFSIGDDCLLCTDHSPIIQDHTYNRKASDAVDAESSSAGVMITDLKNVQSCESRGKECKKRKPDASTKVAESIRPQKTLKPSTESSGLPDAEDENKTGQEIRERKCVREKQRRAELNAAYTSLAKTLSLPSKCNKTSLIQKAEETIKTLRNHICNMEKAKQASYRPAVGNDKAADKTVNMTVPVPWMLGPMMGSSSSPTPAKAPAAPAARESTEKSLVEQMQVCIDRMIKLQELKIGAAENNQMDTGITHSHCA